MPNRLKFIPVLLGLLLLSACAPITSPVVPTETSLDLPGATQAPQPSPTFKPLPTTPSQTPLPSNPTQEPPPTAASPTPPDIGPFHFVTPLPGTMGDPGQAVDMYAPGDGSVWVIAPGSIWRWNGQAAWIPPNQGAGTLTTVDSSGKFWSVNKKTGQVTTWKEGDEWVTYPASEWASPATFEDSWWDPAASTIFPAGENSLWVPSRQDVRMFDGSSWRVYAFDEIGFPVLEAEDISIASQIAIIPHGLETWVAQCYYSGPGPMGGGGVRWFDGQAWYGAGSPVDSDCVSAISTGPAGDVWLGASTTIWHVEQGGQSWTDYQLPGELLSGYSFAHPRQVVVDTNGDAWVGMQMCGGASCDVAARLYRLHDGEWSLVVEAEYWSSSFKQLLLDENGDAWLFWEGTLYRLGDQPLETIAQLEARGVAAGVDGRIWALVGDETSPGLWVYQP